MKTTCRKTMVNEESIYWYMWGVSWFFCNKKYYRWSVVYCIMGERFFVRKYNNTFSYTLSDKSFRYHLLLTLTLYISISCIMYEEKMQLVLQIPVFHGFEDFCIRMIQNYAKVQSLNKIHSMLTQYYICPDRPYLSHFQ